MLETVTKGQEKKREKCWLCAANTNSVWVHRTVSGGASDSVRCARLVGVNLSLSGLNDGVWLTFIGPFGGALDCPVPTGQ